MRPRVLGRLIAGVIFAATALVVGSFCLRLYRFGWEPEMSSALWVTCIVVFAVIVEALDRWTTKS